MKKRINGVIGLCLMLLCAFFLCSCGASKRESTVARFEKNREIFLKAAAEDDFSAVDELRWVSEVKHHSGYVDISCGAAGMGPSTRYWGLFYSETDDLLAEDWVHAGEDLVPEGNGYRWKEENGDNEYYVEPLGDHYFYWEAKF